MEHAETRHRNLSDIDVIGYMKETALSRHTERSAHNESTWKRISDSSEPAPDYIFPGDLENEVTSNRKSVPLIRQGIQTFDKITLT